MCRCRRLRGWRSEPVIQEVAVMVGGVDDMVVGEIETHGLEELVLEEVREGMVVDEGADETLGEGMVVAVLAVLVVGAGSIAERVVALEVDEVQGSEVVLVDKQEDISWLFFNKFI